MTIAEAVDEMEELQKKEENNEGYAMLLLDLGEFNQKSDVRKQVKVLK